MVRSRDLVARWGGEEFAVALNGAGAEGASRMLARLREAWAASGAPTTFSSGYAVMRPTELPAAALARADAALSEAQRTGRDHHRQSGVHPAARSRT